MQDSEHSMDKYAHEYERYGDYEDEVHTKQPMKNIKYQLKTFDDDQESDFSYHSNESKELRERRGPKIIKFKQKKPSERLANSQLKGSDNDDKNNILDLYTPKNKQNTTNIDILRPYKGFEPLEFH